MLGAMSQPTNPPQREPAQQAGLTLIELMVTLTITAVLLGIAVPSMQEMIARRRVAAVAVELSSDLRYMASTGLQRSMGSQLDIRSSCYVVSLDSAGSYGPCDCAQALPCGTAWNSPLVLKLVTLPSSAGISLTSSRANTPFDWRGISQNGNPVSVTISSTSGGKAKVYTVGAIARPYACSLEHQESSFPACSVAP